MADHHTQRVAYSVNQAAASLSLSRATLYRMEADNQIRFKRVRGRTLVPATEVDRVARILEGELLMEQDGYGPSVLEPVVEPAKVRVKKVKLFPKVRA